MHELGIAESVIEAVTERLPGTRIASISLEVGSLSGIVPDSLQFSFDLAAQGTPLEGARLDISRAAARCRCQACGTEFEPDGAGALCPCGSAQVAVLTGQELRITSVQVA
ncbi:MAG TPA: hydrogenase maturation nickel metallochaperone HypA [Streptosporangiaceae bacterium]|nr:hydrogenase maturation nickel metallochaperone HypA [Streptosporangiaceae bacterium]